MLIRILQRLAVCSSQTKRLQARSKCQLTKRRATALPRCGGLVPPCYVPEGEEEEEEEEGLFKADAVNEEEQERDRATQV